MRGSCFAERAATLEMGMQTRSPDSAGFVCTAGVAVSRTFFLARHWLSVQMRNRSRHLAHWKHYWLCRQSAQIRRVPFIDNSTFVLRHVRAMQSVRGRSTATKSDVAGSASLYQSRVQQNELRSRCSAEWTLEKTGWVHALSSLLRGIELYCFSLFPYDGVLSFCSGGVHRRRQSHDRATSPEHPLWSVPADHPHGRHPTFPAHGAVPASLDHSSHLHPWNMRAVGSRGVLRRERRHPAQCPAGLPPRTSHALLFVRLSGSNCWLPGELLFKGLPLPLPPAREVCLCPGVLRGLVQPARLYRRWPRGQRQSLCRAVRAGWCGERGGWDRRRWGRRGGRGRWGGRGESGERGRRRGGGPGGRNGRPQVWGRCGRRPLNWWGVAGGRKRPEG